MELAWLEDFLAVIDCGSFSRAADSRHVTQPAFSRRIRSLEDWIGTPLFERSSHGAALTAAGERFRPSAEAALRKLLHGREDAIAAADSGLPLLRFASTHALALDFFPQWLRKVEARSPVDASIRLIADTMHACEQLLLRGEAQFLLCHGHDGVSGRLDNGDYRSITVGNDVLLPVSAPRAANDPRPRFELPGSPDEPLPLLAPTEASGLSRALAAAQAQLAPAQVRPAFTAHLATVLAAMARDGRGLTWVPQRLVADDLAAGRLVHAGDASWTIPMSIRLYRPRNLTGAAATRLWAAAGGD
ncbi:MAG TPA: LysR family transcriptional regulator [Plasticicumulans sp.]|uniref:LysR family transcriptional regulator n=1 Tax=Plasticicumulans sp. TaxID=2307179 RepID=UPI002BB54954|nr:LysR family transcriptional regulator [Plasticicumulans sp.]HMZ11216.1 LysR family transcriptional regulator [Plasticicumulans sp.]HND98906.1 LysR family transcriptional regulator [Plasticicumulans sp.]HNE00696.1 LysR family transcriptional regulator [Plasticicumulans sp.]HNG49384.1 LysR family transcriptional regulator [Plasticicumulans sp.]HNJ08892.1 LysR family transcriptional regulator [Plasticicumulans sp.]